MARLARLGVVMLAGLTASGCISLSIFQGPETLDEGALVAGVGAAAFSIPGDTASDDEVGLWPEIGLRYGLGSGFDVGAKFAGIPPFGTLYGDVRWQLVPGPVAVTAGLGGSYASVSAEVQDDEEDYSFSALYPSLAVGTDRLWIAGRGIIISSGSADEIFLSETLWGVVAGTSFGSRVRLLPEVEVYFGSDETLVGLGLGLQLGLTGGADGG